MSAEPEHSVPEPSAPGVSDASAANPGGDVEEQKIPFWRSPPFVVFVFGALFVTALRPFLEFSPPAPPVTAELPAWTLEESSGLPIGSEDLAGTVYIAHFVSRGCGDPCRDQVGAVASLRERQENEGVDGIELVTFTSDPSNDMPSDLAAWIGSAPASDSRWHVVGGRPEDVRSLLETGFGVPIADLRSDRLVIVDRQGRLRGYYGWDDQGLDEVFHRSQHVRDD